MGILDKLEAAKAATGGGGGQKRQFSSKQGLWINLEDGDNEIRLGGNVCVCERHYVRDLVSEGALKPQGENRAAVGSNATCMNWDIEGQTKSEEELHCCAVCDLRVAANMKRKEAKDAQDPDQEGKMKDLSGKSYPRARYSWDAISRANPDIETKDADGNVEVSPGWKILGLGKEGTEAIEALAKQYPQLADEEGGCDVVVSRHKSNRVTYGASFSLDGPNIKLTKLTKEEKAMDQIDLIQYVANHISPRVMFESLKPEHQELITEVLGKTASDYPEDCPVKKTPKTKSDSAAPSAPAPKPSAAAPKPQRKAADPGEVTKRSANVADEFADAAPKGETKNDAFEEDTPAAPKVPAAPKAPSAPKAPKAPSAPKEEAPAEKETPASAEEEAAPAGKEDIEQTCFGYFDPDEAECEKCNKSEGCKEASGKN